MKFNDFSAEKWGELQRYFDTCLLPVTGLAGGESPDEATHQLERLRDLLSLVEGPYAGRTVTYPALHYIPEGEAAADLVAGVVSRLRSAGFKYVIIASLSAEGIGRSRHEDIADLWLVPQEDGTLPEAREASAAVLAMWKRTAET
ncbi:hypothetical protein BG53_03760 [Paenibacillus darwinianus]|uniref:DUF2487 domain-containing protein n=1 Tax=Paenibacillus darwinianus TaxID=1380763 RepID=A0A9W5S3Y0_9BACL|nr:DUF2487 family protein [Paenibacillus darwinianus]EXX91297.1 hypothetical protein BG52_11010 [Paenibacillus darwinianus]EXX92113.1 hypothetical protein BG53_03760 [Paenibacillus darwinianus]EXX92558.1 hypothetical protein CH50_10240 [Paenibacillus darwinianus]